MDPGGASPAVLEKTFLQTFLSMVLHDLDPSDSTACHSMCSIL